MAAITPSYDLDVPARVGLHGGIGFITGTATLVTYETGGGVACDLSAMFEELYHVSMTCVSGYLPAYDYTNNKLLVYESGADGSANDECADGALALVFRFFAIGRVQV